MILSNPQIRYLDEMRKVLFDREWAKRASNIPLYYMYRGIKDTPIPPLTLLLKN